MDQVEKYRKIILSKKVTVMAFMWVLIFVGFSTYMISMSKLSVSGFKVSEVEKNIKVLEEENKKLTLELSNIKKMATIEEFGASKKMIKVNKIDYIDLVSSVAMK